MHSCTARNKWVDRLIAVVILSSVSVAGFWLAQIRGSMMRGGLVVSDQDLDIGEVWEQEFFEKRLLIHNPTSENVKVVDLVASCNCSSVKPTSFVVPANGSSEVNVTIDLTSRPSEQTTFLREFVVDIFPVTRNGLPDMEPWRIHGQVRTPLILSSRLIQFERAVLRGVPTESEAVQIRSRLPLAGLDARCRSADVTPILERQSNNREGYLLRVRLQRPMPLGTFRIPIQLVAVTAEGETLPPTPVYVVGQVVNDVHALPDTIYFGVVGPNETCTQTVTLLSRTGEQFIITRVGPQNDHFRADIDDGKYASQHVVKVMGQFGTPGANAETLRVSVTMKSGETTKFAIPVFAHASSVLFKESADLESK